MRYISFNYCSLDRFRQALLGSYMVNAGLLDILLPGMDGMTAMKKLKRIDETQKIPVIAVSGDAMHTDIKRVSLLFIRPH